MNPIPDDNQTRGHNGPPIPSFRCTPGLEGSETPTDVAKSLNDDTIKKRMSEALVEHVCSQSRNENSLAFQLDNCPDLPGSDSPSKMTKWTKNNELAILFQSILGSVILGMKHPPIHGHDNVALDLVEVVKSCSAAVNKSIFAKSSSMTAQTQLMSTPMDLHVVSFRLLEVLRCPQWKRNLCQEHVP